jgi:general secretion pathway protein I
LEVLVALAIAGFALAMMSDAATGGFLASRTAAGYQEALSRAKSHISALGNDSILVPGQAGGDDGGGYRWRYRISELERQNQPGGLALFDVEVGVAWSAGGHQREVVLHTERVARPGGVRE